MSGDEWPAGYGRVVLDTVTSTNAEALRRAAAGERGPVWIAAHAQTAGRGRGDRNWSTEPGNLAATLLVALPQEPPARIATLSFVAGLVVADALTAAAALEVRLKWPNDVLVNGRKIAGILIESGRVAECVVIGIGINLAHTPALDDPQRTATAVAAETEDAPTFDALLTAVAHAWAEWFGRWREDFAPVRAAWLERASYLGEEIAARLPDRTLHGRFEGIDGDGALLLVTQDGSQRIGAAELFPVG